MIGFALFAAVAFVAAVMSERIVDTVRSRANARLFASVYPYVKSVDGAARIVAVCDSCCMTIGKHAATCPTVTGRETAPSEDVRRVP